jgi:hypothetical protein
MSILGWRRYSRVWYSFACLALMLPLPASLQKSVLMPLQGYGEQMAIAVIEMCRH